MDLTTLIDSYRGPLIGLVASWGVPWADAAELAHDSLADAWLNRESCRGDWNEPDVFGRWLRGVALNQYRNWSRARWRRRLRIFTGASEMLEQAAESTMPEASDELDALRLAIARLPTKQRQVVLMHYLEETSVKDVAALLSVPVKTVEGRLYQARRALRRMMGDRATASKIGRMLLCL